MDTPDKQRLDSEPRGWHRFRLINRWYTLASLALAALVLILVNVIGHRIVWRRDVSREGHHRLSQATLLLLDTLPRDVRITALLPPAHELSLPVRDLLREYDHASSRLQVIFLDPHRDLLELRALAADYGMETSQLILVESADRRQLVDVETMAEFDYLPVLYGDNRKLRVFHGETMISSAIQQVSDMTTPVVYTVRGYSERDLNDPHPVAGYSRLAALIRNEQMALRELSMAESGGIPDDADLVLLAGLRRRLSAAELAQLDRYLQHRGRLLVLLDPAETGLESLLAEWGITAARGRVDGLTLSGSELFIGHYGDHPVTRNLDGMTSVFYRPRPLYPNTLAAMDSDAADRLRVSVLAAGRGVLNADGESVSPDGETRLPAVAMAVEKGSARGAETRLRPTRLVVFGDADFVSNSGMVAGNNALVINALNWLVERETRLSIEPRIPDADILLLSRRHHHWFFIASVVLIPALFLILGLAARWGRGSTE